MGFNDGSWASIASTVWRCLRPARGDDDDRGPSIQIAGSADILRGVYDVGRIGQADCRAAVIADYQGLACPREKAGLVMMFAAL